MIATATAEQYRETIRALADWEGIDALIVIFIRPLLTRAEDVAGAIREAVERDAARDPGAGGVHVASGPRGDLRGGGVPDTPLSRGRRSGARPGDAPRRLARRARPRSRRTSRTSARTRRRR